MDEEEEEIPPDRLAGLRRCWRVIRWLVPAVALWYLWREGVFAPGRFHLGGEGVPRLALAAVLLGTSLVAMAVRYHRLLAGLGVPSSLAAHCGIVFPGVLVMQFASEAGFDVMRVVATRRMGAAGPVIVAALLVDRLLGLLSLTALTVVGLAWLWTDGWIWVALFVLGVVLAVPCGFLVVQWFSEKGRGRRFPGGTFLVSVGEAVTAYRHRGPMLLGLFLLSCLSHAAGFAALYCCGGLVVDGAVTLGESLVAGAVATFTQAFPLPLAGLGVGETAFGEVVSLMRSVGETGGFAAVFLLHRAVYVLLGAAAWLVVALPGRR